MKNSAKSKDSCTSLPIITLMSAYEQYISISTAATNSREDVDMTSYFYPNGKAKSVVFPSTDLNHFAKAVTTHLFRNRMNVWCFKRHLSEYNQPNRGYYYGFASFTLGALSYIASRHIGKEHSLPNVLQRQKY